MAVLVNGSDSYTLLGTLPSADVSVLGRDILRCPRVEAIYDRSPNSSWLHRHVLNLSLGGVS